MLREKEKGWTSKGYTRGSKIMLMFYSQTGGIRVSVILVFFITYTQVIKNLLYLFNINKNDFKRNKILN